MKKRILSIMLTLCMMFMLVPTTVFADTNGTTENGLQYTISDETNEVTITGYTGSATNVEIPGKINEMDVTVIGDKAFQDRTSLTSITIQSGVKSIGERAFGGCRSLTSITIPSSVASIGGYAFSGCTKLESITIQSGVTSIGEYAFSGCKSLTSIAIPDSVTSIGKYAFMDCTSLASITISSSVTSIGYNVFRNCTSLTSITIPSSVTSIGDSAFSYCKGLESIIIPSGVTSIGNNAFFYCTGLESIIIPSGVTSIGNGAFTYCSSLTSITIPSGVTLIGGGAFQECTKLTSITIPSGVTSIGNGAFQKCTKLTSITIPNSVTSIGVQAFKDCTSLESIDIPDSVTSIGANAFSNCSKLESIFLPEGLDVTSAGIPGTASQIKYSLDPTTKQITITKITLGEGETSVAIPDEIWKYDVVAVVTSEQSKVGAHTCVIGTATCTTKASCSICGKEYGEFDNTNHNLENIPEKDATVTETGNKEYWYCDDCQKYFSDDEGINEIILENTVISKLAPEIIEGKGQSITAGEKKELTFKSNAAFSDFIRVELDGKTLDAKNYTVKEGSIIVTLNADYVATLSAGEHTIGIVSASGIATTTLTVNPKVTVDHSQSTQTGDNNQIVLWIALLFVSGGILIFNKKKKYNRS